MVLSYNEFINKYYNIKELDPMLPDDIKITTITTHFTFPVIFNTRYIADNIVLDKDFIVSIKYGNTTAIRRSIITKDVKIKNKSKKVNNRQNFYFQTSLIVNSGKINLNIKIFKNGSIQVTGAKNISSILWCLYKIFKIFRAPKNNNFTTPFELANIKCIQNFNVSTINCTFNVGFKLNRTLTYIKLRNDGYNVNYDSSRHSGINLKYTDLDNNFEINKSKFKKRQVTIIIFEKGNVLISGSINYKDIIICYKFLYNYLIENYNEIVKIYE
jgi:TATA-box binding protein (TBP) (component of TFIID and TFIIIB)